MGLEEWQEKKGDIQVRVEIQSLGREILKHNRDVVPLNKVSKAVTPDH